MSHFRVVQGQTVYSADAKQGRTAEIHERTAIGKSKDGTHYLRATNAEDGRQILKAAQDTGIEVQKRRSGASHFGRIGAYDHYHVTGLGDADRVAAVLAGRPVAKSHVNAHQRTVNGKIIQVKEHETKAQKLADATKHTPPLDDSKNAHRRSDWADGDNTDRAHRFAAATHEGASEHYNIAARTAAPEHKEAYLAMAAHHAEMAGYHHEKEAQAPKEDKAAFKEKYGLKKDAPKDKDDISDITKPLVDGTLEDKGEAPEAPAKPAEKTPVQTSKGLKSRAEKMGHSLFAKHEAGVKAVSSTAEAHSATEKGDHFEASNAHHTAKMAHHAAAKHIEAKVEADPDYKNGHLPHEKQAALSMAKEHKNMADEHGKLSKHHESEFIKHGDKKEAEVREIKKSSIEHQISRIDHQMTQVGGDKMALDALEDRKRRLLHRG